MPTNFNVNQNNDLFIGEDGNLSIVTGKQAVLVSCACLAKSILGEMFLQTNRGLPYFESVFSGSPQILQFEAAFRTSILTVDGVVGIQSLVTRVSNNRLIYVATIITSYGIGILNG